MIDPLELVVAFVCALLILFCGTRGQNAATFIGVVGALLHSPQVVVLSGVLAWISSREPDGT